MGDFPVLTFDQIVKLDAPKIQTKDQLGNLSHVQYYK